MADNVTNPEAPGQDATTTQPVDSATVTSADVKGKGKSTDIPIDEDEDDDDEEEDDEEEEDDDDDDEDDEDDEGLNPADILPRTRRAAAQRIDYSSEEALQKAGLTKEDLARDDNDDSMIVED